MRWTERASGAMNVYSMVPSQRSQATVSVRISKMARRYAHTTAPMSRMVVTRFTSRRPPVASIPFAMNTIVYELATV